MRELSRGARRELGEVPGGPSSRSSRPKERRKTNFSSDNCLPSFGLIKTEDKEIWAVVAFVKKLPTRFARDYRLWSQPAAGEAPSKQ